MTNTEPNPPQEFRNFEWKVPLPACKLSRDDIKLLYRIIDDKQIEDRENLVNHILQLQTNETAEVFNARKERVRDACATTITVTGTNGEIITGQGEALLDSSIIPERIASIYFDTRTRFAVLLNQPRTNWASIFLDLTSPSPLVYESVVLVGLRFRQPLLPITAVTPYPLKTRRGGQHSTRASTNFSRNEELGVIGYTSKLPMISFCLYSPFLLFFGLRHASEGCSLRASNYHLSFQSASTSGCFLP
jgi:hypothetical protein